MTSPKLLLPLRVPELGPYLGKVVIGTRRRPGGLSLDVVRFCLATRVFEAAGRARRLAGHGERRGVLDTLGRAVWLEAWEEAVTGVAELVTARVTERLERQIWAVRMPDRHAARRMLDAADRRALAARLGSAGASLVPTLDTIDATAKRALSATALDRAAVESWQDALATAARRLEAAWLALEDAAEAELQRWESVADEIGRWRKPLWPVFAVGAPVLAAALWLGLVLGGFLDSPGWLTRLWRALFG